MTFSVRVCLGQALTFTRQYLLSENAGRRPGIPGVVVVIADRKSEDDIRRPATALRDSGESNLSLTLEKLASYIDR